MRTIVRRNELRSGLDDFSHLSLTHMSGLYILSKALVRSMATRYHFLSLLLQSFIVCVRTKTACAHELFSLKPNCLLCSLAVFLILFNIILLVMIEYMSEIAGRVGAFFRVFYQRLDKRNVKIIVDCCMINHSFKN